MHHKFSFDEYVELVDERSMKLEFVDGQIFAMSGGTPQHESEESTPQRAMAAAGMRFFETRASFSSTIMSAMR
jgi:hypothetical protein